MNYKEEHDKAYEALKKVIRAHADRVERTFRLGGFGVNYGVDQYGDPGCRVVMIITKELYRASINFYVDHGRYGVERPSVVLQADMPYGLLPRRIPKFTGKTINQVRLDKMVLAVITAYDTWKAKYDAKSKSNFDTEIGNKALDDRLEAEGLTESPSLITPCTGSNAGKYNYDLKLWSLTLDQVVALEKAVILVSK